MNHRVLASQMTATSTKGGRNDRPERIAASVFLRRAKAIHTPMTSAIGRRDRPRRR